jgi:antitoxin CptB
MSVAESEDVIRRKRLRFRAWHRGMKEMDLILGRFADERLAGLTEAELTDYETIIACPDVTLYRWITGAETVPVQYDTPLWREIVKSATTL